MKATLEITVELQELTREQGWPKLMAYLFDLRDRLLAKVPLETDPAKPNAGRAVVELESRGEPVVVKLAPDVEELRLLQRHSPAVNRVRLTPGQRATLPLKLPKPIWLCWLKVPYVVTGTVSRQSDNAPFCFGEVDVYDVDIGYCFPRIPDPIIEHLREAIIDLIMDPPRQLPKVIPNWPDWDDDYCGTPPRPHPPRGIDVLRKIETLPHEWAFAKKRFEALSTARRRLEENTARMPLAERQAWLNRQAVEGVTIAQIVNTNTAQLRDLIATKFQAFRYWLCWYPWIFWLWWPYCWWYSLEKLGTASLQPDGSFTLTVWLSICRHDIPDLWFVVRQKISGVERVIYARHPVPCNTYWNWPSNKPVHLVVTDPLAIPCPQGVGTDIDPNQFWIVPLAVGNYSLKRIYGTGAGTLPADNAKIGLYKSIATGLGGSLATFTDGPFGGLVGLRYLFSPALEFDPAPNKVKYYRIKARSNGTGLWSPLTRPVVRHYSHYDPILKSLWFLPYTLGPQTVGAQNGLFEIPPRDPPNKAAEPYAQWYVIDATVDLMNGYFDTTHDVPHGYGLVEFKLELFDPAGTRVNPATKGIPFRIPSTEDVWGVITTADPASVNPALVVADPEDASYQTFIFTLQVDNRQPTAIIDEPTVLPSGNKTGPCGMTTFLATDTSAVLPYQARHPRSFGLYSFDIYRGTTHLDPLARVGRVGDFGPSGSFSVTANLKPDPADPSKPDLLNGCPSAAFSENLYIWNMAFDGWNRVGPDANAVRAFALIPKS